MGLKFGMVLWADSMNIFENFENSIVFSFGITLKIPLFYDVKRTDCFMK